MRKGLQPGFSDHQFADPVHKFVEPFGGNPHGFASTGGTRLAGRIERGCSRRWGDLGTRLRCSFGSLLGADGIGWGGFARRLPRRRDLKRHGVTGEKKDLFDVGRLDIARNLDLPAHQAFCRIKLVERRNGIDHGPDAARSEGAEIIKQQFRVVAVQQGIGAKAEKDAKTGVGLWRRRIVRKERTRIGHKGAGLGHGWERRFHASQAGLEARQDGSAFGGTAFRAVKQAKDLVASLQGNRDKVGTDCRFAATQAVKGGLELVHEQRQFGEAEHRARPLDGVQVAKHRVQEVAVIRRLFQRHQAGFDGLHKLGRFLAVDAGSRIICCGHAFTSLLTTERSFA